MIGNAYKQILLVPTIVSDIFDIEKYSFEEVLHSKSIYYNNLFFSPTGFLQSRKGLHEIAEYSLPPNSEVLNVVLDTDGRGYFVVVAQRQELPKNSFHFQKVGRELKIKYTGSEGFYASKSHFLYFSFFDETSQTLNLFDSFNENIAVVDQLRQIYTWSFGFNTVTYEIDNKIDLLDKIEVDCLKIYFFGENEQYVIKTLENENTFFAYHKNNTIFQDNKHKCVLLGNHPLLKIFYNSEEGKYFLREVEERVDVQYRKEYTFFQYEPDKGFIKIDFEPQYQNILIGEGKRIVAADQNGRTILEGVVTESITAPQKIKYSMQYMLKNKEKYLYDSPEASGFLVRPPFVPNTRWYNIYLEYFFQQNFNEEVYTKQTNYDVSQFEIPGIFTPDKTRNYFFVKKETGEEIYPYIYNPVLNGEYTEDEMWSVFYHTDQALIPQDSTQAETRLAYKSTPLKGRIELENNQDFYDDIPREGDGKVHTTLKVKLETKPSADFLNKRKGSLYLKVKAPIFSSITKAGGYYYGIAQTRVRRKEKILSQGVMLYRSTVAGNLEKWYDKFLGNYLFVDVTGFFPTKDYPITLAKLQTKLLILGTENTQIWEIENLPSSSNNNKPEEDQKLLPATTRFLGKYLGNLPVGVLSKQMCFLHENFLVLLTEKGIVFLNPFTLTGFPEIVRNSQGAEVFKEMLKTTEQRDWGKGFLAVSQTDILLKIGSNFQMLFLNKMQENEYNFSVFTTKLTSDLRLVENSFLDKIFFHVKNQKLYLVKENPLGYDYTFGKEKKSIEIKWFFVGCPTVDTLWANYKIGLSYFLEGKQTAQLLCNLSSLRNRRKTNGVILNLYGGKEVILDQNYGKDFLFKGFQKKESKILMLLCDGYNVTLQGELQEPIIINYVSLFGETREYKRRS